MVTLTLASSLGDQCIISDEFDRFFFGFIIFLIQTYGSGKVGEDTQQGKAKCSQSQNPNV